mgnify:CR=1 FL=1
MANPFANLTTRQKVHIAVVAVCTAAAIGHHAVFWEWFVEDTAITFAFAKHFAEGEGFVPFPGGERVEGYSNPTWTFLMAFLHFVGFDLFEVTKWVQVLQICVTVPVSYLIGREAFRNRPNNDAVLLVPAFVAGNAQFAIYSSAGLENGMLNMFMSLAIWRLLVEARTGGFPWSSTLWMLVAMTRPESITYAAVGGFLSMVFHLHEGRGLKRTLQWLAVFWPPFLAYHAWRYNYFAWPFPNTYYAKLDHRDPKPGHWNKIPWNWQRNWANEMGHGYFYAVYIFGVIGHGKYWRYLATAVLVAFVGASFTLADDQRWLLAVVLGSTYLFFALGLTWNDNEAPRGLVGGGLLAAIGLMGLAEALRYNGFEPNELPTTDFIKQTLPKYALIGGAALVPLLSYGSEGWRTRVTCWLMACAGTFFAVWAEFDWMKGYRWYATVAVPGSVILALGIDSMLYALADFLRAHDLKPARYLGYGWALTVVAGLSTVHGLHTKRVAEGKDPSPKAVRVRVNFVDSVRDRLFVDDERWIDLDVDQGAHLYWSDFEMLDIAGLIDIPMGHHKFDKPFIREYLFEEKRPHYAHVHGGWAGNSKIPTHPEWRRDYYEIPGFPVGGGNNHIGNFVRKDLLLVDESPFPREQRRVAEGGVVLEGFRIPVSPAKARSMYLEVAVSKAAGRKIKAGDFRLLMAVKGPGGVASFDVPLAYDWWPPGDWPNLKVHHGKHAISLPPSLKVGTYDVAFVFVDADGKVLPFPDRPDEPERAPIFAHGEARFDGALTIVTVEQRAQEAKDDREAAIAAAEAGDCEQATELWYLSRRRRPADPDWFERHRPTVNHARAGCRIEQALATDDRDEKVRLLERARYLDRHHPALEPACQPLADELQAEGMAALAKARELQPTAAGQAKQHWEKAYRRLADVMRLDPMRSWSRRYAEEARAYRLGIDPESEAKEEAEKAQKKAEQEKRRQEREEQRRERQRQRDEAEAEAKARAKQKARVD